MTTIAGVIVEATGWDDAQAIIKGLVDPSRYSDRSLIGDSHVEFHYGEHVELGHFPMLDWESKYSEYEDKEVVPLDSEAGTELLELFKERQREQFDAQLEAVIGQMSSLSPDEIFANEEDVREEFGKLCTRDKTQAFLFDEMGRPLSTPEELEGRLSQHSPSKELYIGKVKLEK